MKLVPKLTLALFAAVFAVVAGFTVWQGGATSSCSIKTQGASDESSV